MLGSFDNDMSGLLGGDLPELRDDLEILEEYLGGVLLPPLGADSFAAEAPAWSSAATAPEVVLADAEEAEEPAPEVEAAATTSFTTSTMAEIYVSQGFIQRAIDIYEEMLRDNPTNDAIVQRIGELLEMLEAPAAAAEETDSTVVAAAPAEPSIAPVSAGGPEQVVSTLEQWLSNINSRRR